MFLTTDNIRKKGIVFEPGDTFFRDKERTIPFQDIETYYVSSVDHYTNSAYQGHELVLALGLKQTPGYYIVEACTNAKASYKTIIKLRDAIGRYMEKKILKALESGQDVPFATRSKKHLILVGPNRIRVKFLKGKKGWFEVKKIFKSRDNQFLEFRGGKTRARIRIDHISNGERFISLAAERVPFQLKPESRVKKWAARSGFGLGIGAGLNSWFNFIDGGVFFNGCCTFAGIWLGVTICVTPFLFLVDKLNRRKIRRIARERESA